MVYRGHVENGVVVLDGPVDLPDGTPVAVTPLATEPSAEDSGGELGTLAERLAPFIGCLDGLPSDFSENHDHYLYGVPKRKR